MSARPQFGTVYAVYWPAHRILKVGIMWRDSRIRDLTATGGEVLALLRDSPTGWERYALRELAKTWPRAFADGPEGAEASEIILRRGRGFTECYRVDMTDLPEAVDAILRGTVLHDIDQAKSDTTGRVLDRPEPAPVGEGDSRGAEVACRRPRPRPRRVAADPRRRVAGNVRGDRGGAGGSPARPCRGGSYRPVLRPVRAGVLRVHVVGVGGPSGEDRRPGTPCRETLATSSRHVRGGGEGERESGRERERAGGSQPPHVPRSAPSGPVLPRPPGSDPGPLHRLPERTATQQTVPGSETTRDETGGDPR